MPLPDTDLLPSEDLLPAFAPGDPATIFDYEAPNGGETIYRARSFRLFTDSAGVTSSVSDWQYAEAPVAWVSSLYWLKHPTKPSMNVGVGLRSPAESGVNRAARQGVHQPLGSASAVVVQDTRSASTGTVTFRCDTDAEKEALLALADEQVPLLFQLGGDDHEPDRWLVLGNHTSERLIDKAWAEGTWQSFEWTEVPSPMGNLQELE